MDQVHVVRHKVLVEGRTQRAVSREMGLARVTVRKYLEQAAPTRHAEAGPRARPASRPHGTISASVVPAPPRSSKHFGASVRSHPSMRFATISAKEREPSWRTSTASPALGTRRPAFRIP